MIKWTWWQKHCMPGSLRPTGYGFSHYQDGREVYVRLPFQLATRLCRWYLYGRHTPAGLPHTRNLVAKLHQDPRKDLFDYGEIAP